MITPKLPKYEKLTGAVTFWSNSPGVPTGYGVQTKLVVERLKRHGLDVATLSNYGLDGRFENLETPYGSIPHYPRGFDAYSNDVAPGDHLHWAEQHPKLKDLMITLFDVWVFTSPKFADIRQIASWVPVDHITLPPLVEAWLRRPNVHPLTMAPNAGKLLEAKGIEHSYIPHSIDTRKFKPKTKMPNGQTVVDYFDAKDKFVVGMVAANKSSGLVHRKSYSENILAFSIFKQKHPDAVLYLHTEPLGFAGGWNLPDLIMACGLKKDDVMFPDPRDYRYGVSDETMAALYSGMDVLLAPSMGEGFGVPTMEAQSCGTRVIGSNWAASADLVSKDGWLVDGQPQWDSAQKAWWMIPKVPSIVEALEQAYNKGKSRSEESVDFASNFDVEKIWRENWMPTLKKLLKD
jgi:glycosyltransferase involved in cell wall biosynthesis